MDLFGKICNRGVAYAQILKSAAVSARFFLKLPESGAAVLLALFQLACGYLEKRLAECVSELAHHYYLVIVCQRHNAHSARMDNKLSSYYRAVLKLSLVLSYRNDAALKDNFLINCFFAQMHKNHSSS